MSETNGENGREDDRRFLPRDDVGRRESDRAERELLTDEQESQIQLSKASMRYVLVLGAAVVAGFVSVATLNKKLAPLLNDEARVKEAALVLASGRTYHTYDLNIETRALRSEHIRLLSRTPEVAVLGASHWQEGHATIAPGVDYYNAHVHRDYYEDILGVTEAFIAAGKLPKKMIITIRDNQFLPVEDRTDFLWVPGLEAYRRMAVRLGLPHHNAYAHGLTPQLRQKLSIPLLKANVERYFAAAVKPTASDARSHPTLDTLLPDGSIVWSTIHERSYTTESSRKKALDFAKYKSTRPLTIDPLGVRSVDTLLAFLKKRGVKIYLAHPPYNPIYWDAVQNTPYMKSLETVKKITRDLAKKHGLKIVGSFDPREVGCTSAMYIDSEHSGPECLSKILAQFLKLEAEDKARLAANRG